MKNYINSIDTMLSVWNISDQDERAQLVGTVLEHNVHFVDPPYNIIGHNAFLEMVEATRNANPGLHYSRSSDVDFQNNFGRYNWKIAKGNKVVMEGLDVVEMTDGGTIKTVIGFFGPIKPMQ